LPVCDQIRIAPERAAVETAELIGAHGRVDPRLASIDLGSWVQRSPEQIDPAELGAWMTDTAFASHGGESVTDFVARLDDWLGDCPAADLTAVVTAGTAQGLVAAALGCEFWGVETAPAHRIDLSRGGTRWRVRFGP